MQRNFFDYITISFKGLAMGAADVVPGVSGGTIAFISGIYEELISSISKINGEALKLLFKDGIVVFWKYINGNFFLALLLGIGTSILSLAKLMRWLLTTYPIMVWAFFFGLMIASVFFLIKEIRRWYIATFLTLGLAAVAAYIITIVPPLAGNNGLIFIFFCGALAICAMILPGISGAFILVLLGAYHKVLEALSNWNFTLIAVFGFGAIIGILSFSRALKWFFAKYRELTLAGLTGFIIGSLNKVWPWKEPVITDPENGEAILERSVSPYYFKEITHTEPQLLYAFLLGTVGFFMIYGIEKWANKNKKH